MLSIKPWSHGGVTYIAIVYVARAYFQLWDLVLVLYVSYMLKLYYAMLHCLKVSKPHLLCCVNNTFIN